MRLLNAESGPVALVCSPGQSARGHWCLPCPARCQAAVLQPAEGLPVRHQQSGCCSLFSYHPGAERRRNSLHSDLSPYFLIKFFFPCFSLNSGKRP